MSSVNTEEDQRWVPTHVQVTVLRGRGLRGKGKHGTSDVYTIIQVGKEKYSTCVAEKTTAPDWREECSFELLPGVLENGGRSAYPPGSCDLVLTVMHRALIGLDVFLGQAVIPLDEAFRCNRCVKNEWYRLNSKTGKKEKERGEIQVTVQFTRNNLTASMYDLAIKDKGHSTFSKLKERMRGKKRSSDEDSSSAILPGGYGALYRMRNRLPSDGGGEEEYEDDEGGEGRRSKMRNFFLRGKLRKSSDTRSSTSLGSESSESSSRGGSLSPTAGISVVVSDLSNSPSNSSNLTADNSPEHTANTSPKLSSHKCEFSDEAGEISIAVPQPSVCINGSHAYSVQPLDPGSGKPAGSLGLGLLQKSLPLSMSLQNLSPRVEELPKGPAGDGRRWSFDKAGEEEKAAIAAALEQSGPMQADSEERSGQAAPPLASSAAESESQGKKQRRNLFASAPAEEKQKGWFGSKDSHSKPSAVVSPKLEPSTDSHLPPLPPSHHPSGPPAPTVDPASLASPLHHTNPFCHSQSTPPPMSPCNPFFPLLQHNPFYGDTLTDQALKPSLPPLPYLSSSRPPIAHLFPQASNPNPTLPQDRPAAGEPIVDMDTKSEVVAKVKQRPLPPIPTEGEKVLSKKSSNPFMSAGAVEPDAEWDDSFEAFAAGRLQSPEDLAPDCRPQQNTANGDPLEHCNNKGALLPTTDANQSTNVNDALHPPALDITLNTCTEPLLEANKVTSQLTQSHTENLATFAHFLDTIPVHKLLEGDSKMLNTSANPPELDVCNETKQANNATNTNGITNTNVHQAPCHSCCHMHSTSSPCPSLKLNNNTPNPGSSGVGSSAEEDFLSSLSPYSTSENFSASSSEDAEAQTSESSILGFCKKSSEPTVLNIFSESEENVTDGSDDPSLVDVTQGSLVQIQNDVEKVDSDGSEGQEQSLVPQSMVPTQLPMITMKETDNTPAPSPPNILYSDQQTKPSVSSQSDLQPKALVSLQSDNENREKDICDPKESVMDFPEEVNKSIVSVNNSVEAMIPAIVDDEQASTHPSFYIMTSSPGERPCVSDSPFDNTSLGRPDASQGSPKQVGLFSEFLDTSRIGPGPGQGFDDTLLHTRVSDLSTSSLLHSLYVSTDSQHYQTCQSHPASKCSSDSEETVAKEQAETLLSANSTLCGAESCDEAGEFQSAADTECIADLGLIDSTDACRPSDLESGQICMSEGRTAPLEPSFTIGDDFALQILPNAPTDSYTNSNPNDCMLSEGVGENRHAVLDDLFSKQTQCAALQRSQSEGTMTTSFEDLLMPSFGSDPGVKQESSSAQFGPDLPLLTSFAPSLTAESSSPLALCSLPSLAAASVRSPPGEPQAAAPALGNAKPMTDAPHAGLPPETQQQAANQQNSPHPVKPLTTAMLAEEKRTEGRSVLATGLEKLKSTIHPGRSSQLTEQEPERKKSLTEGAGSYYHLNHSELVSLLVQREAELQRQKAEFERQRVLLAKREVELKKLKPQVRDLEDYIDTLLVRIMEQTPTLLQVRSKFK
ncbi:uncharacterized protein rab11fip5a isoform X1 [Centroberyx gerrardi]